jgi:hypothetical protein
MSSFAEMQDEVLEHQLNDTKYRPSVKRWLNDAQARVCRQASIRTEQVTEDYSTVSGTNTLALPDDYARLIDLRDTDNHNLLTPLELNVYDDLEPGSGKPSDYVIIGMNIELYPNPDGVYDLTLRYWRLAAAMTVDSDTPEIPSDYHYLLPYWALYRCFSRENDIEQATYWKNEWAVELEKLKGEMHYEGQDFPRQLPGTYDEESVGFSSSQWF